MKTIQTTTRGHEPGPTKEPLGERPDNGSRSSRGAGPSSGSRRDNAHMWLKLAMHDG